VRVPSGRLDSTGEVDVVPVIVFLNSAALKRAFVVSRALATLAEGAAALIGILVECLGASAADVRPIDKPRQPAVCVRCPGHQPWIVPGCADGDLW